MDERCGNCRFWNGHRGMKWWSGHCQKRSPVAIQSPTQPAEVMTMFPATTHSAWCGEWESSVDGDIASVDGTADVSTGYA